MTFPGLILYPSTTLFPGGSSGPVSDGLQVTLSGLSLTGTDAAGVSWRTLSPLAGWDGGSGSSVQLTQKTRGPGAWPGPANLTPRTISFGGFIEAPDVDSMQTAIDQLNAAVTLGDTILTITRGSSTRSCIVRRQDEVMIADVTDTICQWSLQLVAPDPRKFTSAVSGSTALPSSSGGIRVPLTVPFAINSTVVSGRVQLTNPGTASGPVVLRIDGPVTGPQVTHLGTGLQLTFGSSLQLNSGEFLLVDMEAQTSLANGQVSRNSSITNRGWSGVEPGVNTWAFAALAGSGLLTVTATPSWL